MASEEVLDNDIENDVEDLYSLEQQRIMLEREALEFERTRFDAEIQQSNPNAEDDDDGIVFSSKSVLVFVVLSLIIGLLFGSLLGFDFGKKQVPPTPYVRINKDFIEAITIHKKEEELNTRKQPWRDQYEVVGDSMINIW